jgi:type II secretory pathway component PulF
LFRYKVADAGGRVQEVVVEGATTEEATRRVRGRGLVPIQLVGSGEGEAISGGGGGFLGLFGAGGASGGRFGGARVPWGTRWDAVEFTDRLAPLLEAEIALERSGSSAFPSEML